MDDTAEHPDDPYEAMERVQDEASFLEFLATLARDREIEDALEKKEASSPYGSGARGWENNMISTFLEAAASCGKAHLGKHHRDHGNPWKACAAIILSGKSYE